MQVDAGLFEKNCRRKSSCEKNLNEVCKSTCRDLRGDAAGARDPFSLGNKIRLTLTYRWTGGTIPPVHGPRSRPVY